MIILGIDPGVERLGIAVLTGTTHHDVVYVASNCLTTSKNKLPHIRLLELYVELRKWCNTYRPNCLIMEQLLFSKNVKTAITVAQVQGIIMLVAAEFDIELKILNPMTIKSSVTGDGNADKVAVKKMVDLQIELPQKHRLDDEYDAIACAYAYFLC